MKVSFCRKAATRCTAFLALAVLCGGAANASPQYAQKEGVNCQYCHVTSGHACNFRGLYYASHNHSFADFDNIFEAKVADVAPNSMGTKALPRAKDYPSYTVAPALDFMMKDIDGNPVRMGRYQGDVLLVVNVASFCGNTPQYAGLQKLYEKRRVKGFTVLGFPANDFGKQEPGSEKEIKAFCTGKYKVTFPMFSKIVVKGDGQSPFYRFLTGKETDPKFAGDVEWNFAKFLINRKGEIVARFPARTDPLSPDVVSQIEKQLAAPR